MDTCRRSTPVPTTIAKGSCITASWFVANSIGTASLAGVQAKVTARAVSITGTIVHIRADDPVNPTKIVVYVDPDPDAWTGPVVRPIGCTCPNAHVAIDADRIVGIDESHVTR
jgi:hypothetical protein